MLTRGTYLLDTCICIALIKEEPAVVEHIRRVGVSECKISDLTIGELYFGAYKSGRKEHFDDVIDLLIGATALHEDLILVTGNVRHFSRIPGLRVENWMVPKP